jgi:hypothetical protein
VSNNAFHLAQHAARSLHCRVRDLPHGEKLGPALTKTNYVATQPITGHSYYFAPSIVHLKLDFCSLPGPRAGKAIKGRVYNVFYNSSSGCHVDHRHLCARVEIATVEPNSVRAAGDNSVIG